MRNVILAALSGMVLSAPAFAEEKREADAHEHGHGSFNMAIEGETVAIELETPSFDILGFEHEARSAAEKDAVKKARDILANPIALFGIPKAADCRVAEAEIEFGAEEEHHDHEEEHDDHAEGHDQHDEEHDHHAEGEDHHDDEAEHSEIHAHYTLACGAPDELGAVNASAYFKAFPNAAELDVAILTDAGQKSGELEPDNPELSF